MAIKGKIISNNSLKIGNIKNNENIMMTKESSFDLLKYLIDNETGNYLRINFNETTYVYTISMYSKSDKLLSSIEIDGSGNKSKLIDVSLDYNEKKLVFTFFDGSSLDCDISTLIDSKQDKLYDSGEKQNIKTINNQSILGTGNLVLDSGKIDTISINNVDIPAVNKNVNLELSNVSLSGDFDDLEHKPNMWVGFSFYSDGTDFTTSQQPGQCFVGVGFGANRPLQKTSYTWYRFTGNETELDETTVNINETVNSNKSKSFTAPNMNYIILNIPSVITMDYVAEMNFKFSGSQLPSFQIVNQSSYTLKIVRFGEVITSFQPVLNHTANCYFWCDGIYVYCVINEIS